MEWQQVEQSEQIVLEKIWNQQMQRTRSYASVLREEWYILCDMEWQRTGNNSF